MAASEIISSRPAIALTTATATVQLFEDVDDCNGGVGSGTRHK